MIDIPSASTILTSSSAYAMPFFNEFFQYGLIAVGIFVGFVLVAMIVLIFKNGVLSLVHHIGKNEHHTEQPMTYDKWKQRENERGYRTYE